MDFGQQALQVVRDPNVAYILMIAGLWMAVIAVTTPGTGFAEVTAAFLLVLAAIGLLGLGPNIAGILLIVLAFVLFAVDVVATSHGVLTIGGLIALLVGSLLLFPGGDSTLTVSGWLIAGVVLGSAGMAGIVLHALRRSLRQRNVDLAALNVDGATGRVRSPITAHEPGTVQVAGQLWTATADEPMESGADVVVRSRDGLTLHVARPASTPVESTAHRGG